MMRKHNHSDEIIKYDKCVSIAFVNGTNQVSKSKAIPSGSTKLRPLSLEVSGKLTETKEAVQSINVLP